MNRTAFYAALRRRDSGVFGTSLTQAQVQGVDAILDEAEKRGTALPHLAYILATPYHETGARMQPVRENMNYSVQGLLTTFGRHRISAADARQYGRTSSRPANQQMIANLLYGGEWGRENLGNTQHGDGWLYRGGGMAQITGRTNFTKFGMASDPARSGDLIPSVRMMFDGMERGLFTGKKLADFTDYQSMRQIINGTDDAALIAGYARAFEAALQAAGYSEATKTPAKPQPPPTGKKPGSGAVIVGGGALIAAGLATWWSEITAWLSSLFGG
ncbi:MAG: hypothetical protein RL268_822 [Pseudomonadota bacterium]|jgi:putative chitinase